MPISLHPRCNTDTCIRCRKKLEPGDRVTPCMIVEQVGRNQTTRELGAFLSSEFELSHIDCRDRALTGQLIPI